jgi:hypothetical protein
MQGLPLGEFQWQIFSSPLEYVHAFKDPVPKFWGEGSRKNYNEESYLHGFSLKKFSLLLLSEMSDEIIWINCPSDN